jgi:D-serine deaminase-like pyridoxal phosphate-dependent protein
MMDIDQVETPAAVVDLDVMDANILQMQQYMDEHGIANRPHIKTHKIPEIAHLQVEAGAVGITCQKLTEAEIMAEAGIEDIFLPYNILGESKLDRLFQLARRVKLSVTVDSPIVAQGLSDTAAKAGMDLVVLVEFDAGLHRCGVQSPTDAADLARLIHQLPGLGFGGLMTYPSNENLDPFVRETKSLLKGDGIDVERVSGGGTLSARKAHTYSEVTEHRPGSYVYGDRYWLEQGVMPLETCAMKVISTFVSRPTTDRAILDAGSKSLSTDSMGLEGHGLILEYPDAKLYNLNEEHGYVDVSSSTKKPEIGERVSVIPNHCCAVTNLFNHVVGLRGGQVEVVWPVAARGAVQ